MARLTIIAVLFFGFAACGDSSASNDASAQVVDAGYDGDTQD
jgi:hypothetical protein